MHDSFRPYHHPDASSAPGSSAASKRSKWRFPRGTGVSAILAALGNFPGSTLKELVERTWMDYRTVNSQIAALERQLRVVAHTKDVKRCRQKFSLVEDPGNFKPIGLGSKPVDKFSAAPPWLNATLRVRGSVGQLSVVHRLDD